MASESIVIRGAREHNLKNLNLEIPKNKLVVFTGLSGSGKSTLAFDTLYAEGQRRYMESLSSYARQFLDRVGKPDVDKIEGLTPAIAIDQKTTSKNPRSTVGTITEIYDYLRLLYARIGIQHCHKCGKPISKMSASDIINEIQKLPEGAKVVIYAPLVREKKGTWADLIENLRGKGYVRAQIDGADLVGIERCGQSGCGGKHEPVAEGHVGVRTSGRILLVGVGAACYILRAARHERVVGITKHARDVEHVMRDAVAFGDGLCGVEFLTVALPVEEGNGGYVRRAEALDGKRQAGGGIDASARQHERAGRARGRRGMQTAVGGQRGCDRDVFRRLGLPAHARAPSPRSRSASWAKRRSRAVCP